MAKRWKIILAVGIGVVVVCCGGGGFAVYKQASSASAAVRDPANAFVAHLEAGEVDTAYDSLCADTKEHFGKQAFADYVGSQQRINSHKVTGFSMTATTKVKRGTVTMTLDYAAGGSGVHQFVLVQDGGAFKVGGDPI